MFEKYENPKINSNDKPEKHEKAEKPAKPRLSGTYLLIQFKNWPPQKKAQWISSIYTPWLT